MMGYVGAQSVGLYGSLSDKNFIMDNVECVGDELSLFDCPHITNHNCGTTEGAKVTCKSMTLDEGKNIL